MTNHGVTQEFLQLSRLHEKATEGIPFKAEIKMPWRADVVSDKKNEARKKLGNNASDDEYQAKMEEAEYVPMSERWHKLIDKSLSGTAFGILESAARLIELEEVHPVEVWSMIGSLALASKVIRQIPEEHRNNAIFTSDSGYYWGGFYQAFATDAH